MVKLPNYKVNYYLDETDQIEVDGHTLSRLYLAEEPPELFTKMHDYAIYGEDNTNRKMGGYVESLDCLTDTVTYHGHICWVDEDSRVYGDSKIGRDVTIHRSTIANSKVTQARGAWVADSTIINSTVNLVKASAIINSTCTKEVLSSSICDSHLKVPVTGATVDSSRVSGPSSAVIFNADLVDVHHHGSLSGTFRDISEGDITIHTLYYRNGKGKTSDMSLLIDTNGHTAVTFSPPYYRTLLDKTEFRMGDITLNDLKDIMSTIVDGKTIGTPKTIELLESLDASMVLTDDDFDLENNLER